MSKFMFKHTICNDTLSSELIHPISTVSSDIKSVDVRRLMRDHERRIRRQILGDISAQLQNWVTRVEDFRNGVKDFPDGNETDKVLKEMRAYSGDLLK